MKKAQLCILVFCLLITSIAKADCEIKNVCSLANCTIQEVCTQNPKPPFFSPAITWPWIVRVCQVNQTNVCEGL
jgi:hypothetical protein